MTALIRSEWTKFVSVRAWYLAAAAATLVILVVGLLSTAAGVRGASGAFPADAHGRSVDDSAYLVHRTLTGDGGITSQVGLAGRVEGTDGGQVVPWAKAGLVLKDGLVQGSPYAAIVVTGTHGVRFQHDYTEDVAGPDLDAAWLRLTRAGDVVTGAVSTDGINWTTVGRTTVPGLPDTVQIGELAASPQAMTPAPGGASFSPAVAIGTFQETTTTGRTGNAWVGEQLGGAGNAGSSGSYSQTLSGGWTAEDGRTTITGAGDIAPVVAGTGTMLTLENLLVGAFAGVVVLVVLGCLDVTSEFRTGMVSTTFAATPARGRVLVAKVLVISAVAFGVGVLGALLSLVVGEPRARSIGFPILSVPPTTVLRVVAGTGLLLAVTAVLALAVAISLRRSATAVTVVVAGTIVPYVLALSGVLPVGASEWLLRLTPAAGFAVQQTTRRYEQVLSSYVPAAGYYPLGPWAGFGVLCLWALAAVAVATVALRRRDVR